MGLDTTHECWHGPYSSFMEWRRAICVAAGWGSLDEYEGFGGYKAFPADDPLTVLLAHSDCEGMIESKDCLPLAERLERLLDSLWAPGGLLRQYSPRARAEQFIIGLRLAAMRGENVEFH